MSGFEVVGVILGASPLIISALEGYKELNRRRDFFFKRACHINRMINALYEQQKVVEGDLQVLLSAAGIEHIDLQLVRAGSCQELLRRPDVVEEVKDFLQDRYEIYLQKLSDCEEILFRVARAVGGLKQGPLVSFECS